MKIGALVDKNELLIEKYNAKAYLENKKYAIYGAISALEITNEVQKNYIKHINDYKDIDALLMQLYGMLQSLFVSVDSLYELSYSIVGSKKFININQNKYMRELKHIRNDVVGHPANRVLGEEEAYCVLDKKSLTSQGFNYLIYSDNDVKVRSVDLLELVEAYYDEANTILGGLLNFTKVKLENDIIALIKKIIENFDAYDYMNDLEELHKLYLEKYPDSSKKQHRFLWRYELVLKLKEYEFKKLYKNGLELKNDIIYDELFHIYNVLNERKMTKKSHSDGVLLKAMYSFLKKNKDLYSLRNNLCDFSHPHFMNTYKIFKKRAHNNLLVLEYLGYLEELINKEESDLIYAYMAPLKAYTI